MYRLNGSDLPLQDAGWHREILPRKANTPEFLIVDRAIDGRIQWLLFCLLLPTGSYNNKYKAACDMQFEKIDVKNRA